MSKSKKNTVDPEQMIKSYGADAVRLFILSDSPPEKDVQWSEQGMVASYKFIQKFWALHKKIVQKLPSLKESNTLLFDDAVEEFTNQMLNKINLSLNKFSYNVIIANLHEIYNFFNKTLSDDLAIKNLIDNYEKILTVMIPIVPHLATECLNEISDSKTYTWPVINNEYLNNKIFDIVVQINGKKRGLISTKKNFGEKNLIEKIKQTKELNKFLVGSNIVKSIFIKDKLINLITK